MWILSFKNWKENTLASKNVQTEQNKLSKTNIGFSRFEGTIGEKTKYFAPKEFFEPKISSFKKLMWDPEWILNNDPLGYTLSLVPYLCLSI